MSDGLDKTFEELKDEYYPGSKQKKRVYQKPPQKKVETTSWESRYKIRTVTMPNGVQREIKFYTVGALAKALGRESVTIRLWQRQGIIPPARFMSRSSVESGKRRLYTKRQIESVIKIAQEEGVIGQGKVKKFEETNFAQRVQEAWATMNPFGEDDEIRPD